MTLQEKLNAMNTPKSTLFIFKGAYRETYHCSIEYKDDKCNAFKLQSEEYDNIEYAVEEVYTKFKELTKNSFKEAIPALLTIAG